MRDPGPPAQLRSKWRRTDRGPAIGQVGGCTPAGADRGVWECGSVASGSASRRTAARSSAVPYWSGKAWIAARVGCVAVGCRRGSVPALLQAQAAILRGSVVSGGRRVAGRDVFSAGCSRLPLVVSSTGVGGWVESASRPRGRGRSAGGRLRVPVAMGSIIRSYEQFCKSVRALPRSSTLPVGVDSLALARRW